MYEHIMKENISYLLPEKSDIAATYGKFWLPDSSGFCIGILNSIKYKLRSIWWASNGILDLKIVLLLPRLV